MSKITIARELLQQILDEFFELEAENRAYFGMWQKMRLYGPEQNQPGLHKYNDEIQVQKAKELSGKANLRTALRAQVQSQDDAAFLAKLVPQFSPD
jgi:hypothetical protein